MLAVTILLLVVSSSSLVQGGWKNLTPGGGFSVWKDNGNSWSLYLKHKDNTWHYGPARLWTTPVNSDHYEITSRLFTSSTSVHGDCGHMFKYKPGSVTTKPTVTKAWGYFLWSRLNMYITAAGKENSPRINYKYKPSQWYDLKTIVKGAVVKIYIDNVLVKQVTITGQGATSKTNNYVGLWCHGSVNDRGTNFKVKNLSYKPTPSRPSGTQTTPKPNKHLKCGSNSMQIAIPKTSLPFVDAKDLRLNQSSCRATEDKNNFYLKTAFDKCGTKTNKTASTITYSNQILGRALNNSAVISRIRDIKIEFSCSYPRKTVVMSSRVQPNITKYYSTFHSQGKFNFSLELFPSNQFVKPYNNYPITLHLRQEVYIQVEVKSVGRELSVLAQQCYATPSSNGGKPKHWLIKDSCPVDPTVKNLTSTTKNVQRFSVQAFRFVGNHNHVYFHCHVIACNGNDVSSVCARGCSKNKIGKRGEHAQDNSILVTQGPVTAKGLGRQDEPVKILSLV